MNAFQSVKECPKCGKKLFTATNNSDLTKRTFIPAQLIENEIIQEHLIVMCPDCGYEWKERCKDNSPN